MTGTGKLDPAALALHELPGSFAVCRLPPGASPSLPGGPFACVVATAEETSVICAEHLAPAGARVVGGFVAFRVGGTFDFGVVGVLAAISRVLAEARVPILACSSFDTDYLLVRADDRERAAAALRAAGITVELVRDAEGPRP